MQSIYYKFFSTFRPRRETPPPPPPSTILNLFRTRRISPSPPPRPRRRRFDVRKRRTKAPPTILIAFLYIGLAFMIATKLFAAHSMLAFSINKPSQPKQLYKKPPQLPLAMRPPQFGEHLAPPPSPRDTVPNRIPPTKSISDVEQGSRTCYHSSARETVCVHVPFCVRHASIAYLADTLRCAPRSESPGGAIARVSATTCVEIERELESIAEISPVEHMSTHWLTQREKSGHVLWFEGDSIYIRMSSRCKSVAHYADRIFLLHHILQHPERYGMGRISNIIIAAHPDVARKIRYTKSWHHGLLAAIIYPNKPIYSHKAIEQLISTSSSSNTQIGELRVFVPPNEWDVARGRMIPCFRRVALSGAVRHHYFLSKDEYPGILDDSASSPVGRYGDADVFRTLLFQSLGHVGPPAIKAEMIYLHRTSTRTFSRLGLITLEEKLREVTRLYGFSYRLLDVGQMTFPQQIEAVAGAGVVIGIHGTQMLNTLFLPPGSGVIEIFPFEFKNRLYEGGSGAGLHYGHHQLIHGDDFPGLPQYKSVEACQHLNRDCHAWYRSDNRELNLVSLDAAAIGKLAIDAMTHARHFM